MRRRERDFNKLIRYTRLIGLRIKFAERFKESRDIVGFYTPPEYKQAGVIEIATKRMSMLTQMTTLLHELGHHFDYIKRGGWSKKEMEASDIFEKKGSKSPSWVKKSLWDMEENANQYILKIAKYLDIHIPMHSFYYDLEKTRKQLRLELQQDKIKTPQWRKEKRKIRARLRGVDASKKKYKKHRY
jgi:hypothetical protein